MCLLFVVCVNEYFVSLTSKSSYTVRLLYIVIHQSPELTFVFIKNCINRLNKNLIQSGKPVKFWSKKCLKDLCELVPTKLCVRSFGYNSIHALLNIYNDSLMWCPTQTIYKCFAGDTKKYKLKNFTKGKTWNDSN